MKKAHRMVLCLLLLTISVAAQQSSEISAPPSVTILEMRWYFELPWQDSDSIHPRYEKLRTSAGEVWIPRPSRRVTSPDRVYVYSFKVRNNSKKKITRIYWEYQFLDPDIQQQMGTRRIFSNPNLAPGKTRVIRGRSRRQPTIIVSAEALRKEYKEQFTARLIIHRIHYADGTAWQRPLE